MTDNGFILCLKVGRLTSVVGHFDNYEDLCNYATTMNGIGMKYENQYVFYKVGRYLLRSPYTVFRLDDCKPMGHSSQCLVDK